MGKKETEFKNEFRKKLLELYPDSFVLYTDPLNQRSFPDVIFLYKNVWACFEMKKERNSDRQANQEYYVDILNNMSFSRFVEPDNISEVLYELDDFIGRFSS